MATWRASSGVRTVAAGILAGGVLLLGLGLRDALAETRTFQLRNGDIVRGEVLERDERRVVIQHAVLGRLEIPTAELASATTHPGLLGSKVLAGWTKELNLGLGGSYGDTDEADLRIATSLDFKDATTHWRIQGRYVLGFTDGEIDDHNAQATLLRDWLWAESKWFAFTYGLYDYDDFEAWKHRLTAGLGPGYHLVAGEDFKLDGRAGPFFTYEFGDENAARPEGAVGLFASWKFHEFHSLELTSVYFQTLDESEFRLVSRFSWKIRLSTTNAVSLKLGLDNEYDSASKKSENNLRYFTSIVFDG